MQELKDCLTAKTTRCLFFLLFEEYKKIVQKTELTDRDFAKAAELEFYLDEVPDYLALEFASEYSRLKLEFSKRG